VVMVHKRAVMVTKSTSYNKEGRQEMQEEIERSRKVVDAQFPQCPWAGQDLWKHLPIHKPVVMVRKKYIALNGEEMLTWRAEERD
jgi:hypothetical protein